MTNREIDFDWFSVIGRCLAYICLKNSKHADSSLLEQAAFLERMGLPVGDRADVLGTSRDSLRVLGHQARRRKEGKKNGKAKRR